MESEREPPVFMVQRTEVFMIQRTETVDLMVRSAPQERVSNHEAAPGAATSFETRLRRSSGRGRSIVR
jgi:hypothetical protein